MELVHSAVRSLPLRPEATSLWLKKKRPLRELCFSHKGDLKESLSFRERQTEVLNPALKFLCEEGSRRQEANREKEWSARVPIARKIFDPMG